MTDKEIDDLAIDILAEHGSQCTREELLEYIDDQNAVLKLMYCKEAIVATINKFVNNGR